LLPSRLLKKSLAAGNEGDVIAVDLNPENWTAFG
jgi:hypothetical protein